MRTFWLLALTLITSSGYAATEPKPGIWNLSATVMLEGASQVLGPYTQNRCMSSQDLRDPEKIVADESEAGCTYSDKHFEGNRFSFSVQCTGVVPMTGSGSVTFDASSFQGEVNIQAKMDGAEINSITHVAGKRTGDCSSK